MKLSVKNETCVIALGALLAASGVSAIDEAPDIQAFLPLLERNFISGKVLEASYTRTSKGEFDGKDISTQKSKHFVFDAETGRFREEEIYCNDPAVADVHTFQVSVWDGKEFVSWQRSARTNVGSRVLGPGIYEDAGYAVVAGKPFDIKAPPFIGVDFNGVPYPSFAEVFPKLKPKLGTVSRDTVTVETEWNKIEFFKNGALKRFDFYDESKEIYVTYEFSNHVERSGIWIPLRIVYTRPKLDGNFWCIEEIAVDPKTLRLLDKADPSVFTVSFPAGCIVDDRIRKKQYQVTTLDTNPPQDMEAIQKTLDKMQEQAGKQKAAADEK